MNKIINDAIRAADADEGAVAVRLYYMDKKSRKGWLRVYTDASDKEKRKGIFPRRVAKTTQNKVIMRNFCIISLILLVVAAVIIVVSILKPFKLKNVFIEGDTPYSEAQLLEAAGMDYGSALFAKSRTDTAEAMMSKLPYLAECSIKRSLSGTLTFRVKAEKALIYTQIAGDYYALSDKLRVLERSAAPETFENAGLVYTSLPGTRVAIVGRTVEFSGSSDTGYITDFLGLIGSDTSGRGITRLFLEDRFDIVAVMNNSVRISFGSSGELSLKLDVAGRIAENIPEGTAAAEIDVTTPKTATLLELDSIDAEKRH